MTTIKVVVKNDHLQRLASKRPPMLAVAELIWNAVDGDGRSIDVYVEETDLGGLHSLRVVDDGNGIPHATALAAFKNLGASWKRGKTSAAGRKLHGQAGEGRFSAFSIGTHVKWTTTWRDGAQTKQYEIEGDFEKLGQFEVTDPVVKKSRRTGTEVEITGITKTPGSLLVEDAVSRLAELFALYLRQYPDVRIRYAGKLVDPSIAVERAEDCPVEGVTTQDGVPVRAVVTIIEWKNKVERELVLCDAAGFALATRGVGIQAKGFSFTAYLKSDLIRDLYEQNFLDLEDLHPDLRALVEATRTAMKNHFRRRAAEGARAVVDQWKEQKVYPYEGTPKNPVEEVERQVFDVVALNVNEYLPEFAGSDGTSKRFSLRMLKTAVEQSPGEVRRIIQEVLDLPPEKREELAELLDRTTLSSIINASKVVVNRLDFLAGLKVILFDTELREKTKERQHLHRLLAQNPWIFGEEYHLSVDDQDLKEVLRKHLTLLGRAPGKDLAPVETADGKKGIVDLMLSRSIKLHRADEFEHLVVELKRPSQDINADVVQQIQKYAAAVGKDERFRDCKVRWVFWAVSNDIDEFARGLVNAPDRPPGVLQRTSSPDATIWLKSWGQVLAECEGRLRYFQDRLNLMATHESGLEHLQKMYAKYIPDEAKKAAHGAPAPADAVAAADPATIATGPTSSDETSAKPGDDAAATTVTVSDEAVTPTPTPPTADSGTS